MTRSTHKENAAFFIKNLLLFAPLCFLIQHAVVFIGPIEEYSITLDTFLADFTRSFIVGGWVSIVLLGRKSYVERRT